MISDSLLIKYLAGEADSNEKSLVSHWLNQNPKNEKRLLSLKSLYEEEPDIIGEAELKEDWDRIANGIKTAQADPEKRSTITLYRILRAAAAILILLLGTALILKLNSDNLTIRGNSETPVAAFLPDGSEVYLTKGSRLRYSKNFNEEIREVSISGDAYFAVTSDPARPFIVQTGEAKIRVTGTSFRVSAPEKDDEVEVMVRSGKVLFYNSETFSENSFKVGLYPGDKGTYSSKLNQLNKTHDSKYKQLSWN